MTLGSSMPASAGTATFLDFDGTLADTNLIQIYLYYARHAGRLGEVARRHARLAADGPALLALEAANRTAFAKRLFQHYEGLSEDRLWRLSGRLYDEVIARRVHAHTAAFVAGCKAQGRVVLVTGAPAFTVARFAERFGVDDVIATQLEFRHGLATGRLVPPLAFGAGKAEAMRAYARRHGLDLERCAAYSDAAADVAMFHVVGRAGVVNPSPRLAQLARDHHWQILSFSPEESRVP